MVVSIEGERYSPSLRLRAVSTGEQLYLSVPVFLVFVHKMERSYDIYVFIMLYLTVFLQIKPVVISFLRPERRHKVLKRFLLNCEWLSACT